MPVETMTPSQILERYPETGGRITDYLAPTGHKWYDGELPGTTTDDWQLTAAVARAMIRSPLDMDEQVKEHVAAYGVSTKGWGRTTREAVRKVANNVHWSQSREHANGRGRGNGVVMKIAPAAMYYRTTEGGRTTEQMDSFYQFLFDLTAMTHRTRMAMVASLAHACAVYGCFGDHARFTRTIFGKFTFLKVDGDTVGMFWPKWHDLSVEEHDIAKRLDELRDWKGFDFSKPEGLFGGGSCYVYDSLPFTYAWFLKDPDSIESLYDCVSAGGDADSNGAMLGSMLGARHGTAIFPQHLVDGLRNREEVLSLADEFCDKFGIKD